MAHFMVRDDPSLLYTENPVFFLLSNQDHFHCLKEILLGNRLSPILNCQNRRLVYHIGEIRAHCPRGGQRNRIKIYRLI